MSIVDDLIANLVQRNAIKLKGTLAIRLVDGGVAVSGTLTSTVRDQSQNKDILTVGIPVAAQVKVQELVIPVPTIP